MEAQDSQSNPNIQSSGPFLDCLINDLAELQPPEPQINEDDPPRTQRVFQEKQPQNPLSRLPAPQLARVKPLMLTLHCLFPNDLLPALDILDRGLVQRFIRRDRADMVTTTTSDDHSPAATPHENKSNPDTQGKEAEADDPEQDKKPVQEDIFFVTSTSSAPPAGTQGTSQAQDQRKGYEVRLHAWNCTCPTFTLSAFRDMQARTHMGYSPGSEIPRDQRGTDVYAFGGTLTCATDRASPPVCKHILASILFARCPGLFGGDGDHRCLVSMEELAGWCAGWGG